ncbi:hypothetical protein EZS27_044497, partial [termite gut metagenome]
HDIGSSSDFNCSFEVAFALCLLHLGRGIVVHHVECNYPIFLFELAGLEGILGAFLAGLMLNRLIPSLSPLMNRIEFVGNALFIPYFLIGVGMIINIHALFAGGESLKVTIVMILVATGSKWLSARLAQKTFRMYADERSIMFGLSNAHAAAALAVVLIGNKVEISPG